MPNKIELTRDFVRDLSARPKKGGRLYFLDSVERGLQLSVTQTGVKSFFWRGTFSGRDQRIPLGRFPETTVAQARTRCVMVRAAIEQGRDPRAALAVARRKRGAVSLADFFEIYLDGLPPERERETVRKIFDYYAADIKSRPIASLTPGQLKAWHRKIGEASGPYAANKAIGLIGTIYNRAIETDDPRGGKYAYSNPATAKAVPRYQEDDRDRFMSLDELRALRNALGATESRDARDFFRVCLGTCQRKTNVKEMAFADIDLHRGIWIVPRLKGGKKNHPVPLVTPLVDIIKFRRRLTNGSFVFPGRRRGDNHIANVDTWWGEICEKAGLENLRIHDLRRTTASYMAMTGAPYQIIAQLLAHKMPGPTAIYARLDVEPVRKALETALEEMGFGAKQA